MNEGLVFLLFHHALFLNLTLLIDLYNSAWVPRMVLKYRLTILALPKTPCWPKIIFLAPSRTLIRCDLASLIFWL
jgi:hypothetical protein